MSSVRSSSFTITNLLSLTAPEERGRERERGGGEGERERGGREGGRERERGEGGERERGEGGGEREGGGGEREREGVTIYTQYTYMYTLER